MNNDKLATFRKRIQSEPVFGTFSKTEDPAFIECMGHAGFDFCIIDLEHGPNNIQSIQSLVRAAELANTLPIVRVPEGELNIISRALDVGAAGVQVPQITSAESARAAINHARYAPLGMRGVCRYVRGACYSATEPQQFFNEANDALAILQLEGVEALDNLDEILNVPGIDVLFIGPYDLSQSLGVTGQTQHPKVIETVQAITAKCKEQGIVVGTFVETAEEAEHWRSQGIHYLSYRVDVGIFYSACSNIMQELRTPAMAS